MHGKSIAGILVIALICTGSLVVQGRTGRMGPWIELMDIWEHAAAVAEIAYHPSDPQNPLLNLPVSTSPRITPYIVALAAISRTVNSSALTTLYYASFFNLFLFCCALFLLVNRYLPASQAPAFTLLFMLSLWGEGWRYSSEYCLVSFIYYLSYPSSVSFSLSLLGLYILDRWCNSRKALTGALYILISAIIFTTHTLTWSFLFVASLVLLLVEKTDAKQWAILPVSLGIAFCCGVLWPSYDILQLIKQSLIGPAWYETAHYLHTGIIRKAGPSLVLIPIPVMYLMRREFLFPASACIACFMVYLLSYVTGILLVDRFIYFGLFFLYVCGGIFVAQALQERKKLIRLPAFALMSIAILCFFYQAGKLSLEFSGIYVDYGTLWTIKKYQDPVRKLAPLHSYMAAGSVVISDTITSWAMPAQFHVKVVSLLHNNPLVLDNDKRLKDVEVFFSEKTDNSKRKEILQRYSVAYILMNKSPLPWESIPRVPLSITAGLKQLGSIVYEDQNLLLINVG